MNAFLRSDPEVLVVGAGPTGLMAAAQLAERGIRARIIDAAPERSDKSRALGVQARTLELLDKMGLASRLVARGHRTGGMNFHVEGRAIARYPLGQLDVDHTPFPFLLFVSQVETERVLEEHLRQRGVEVERPVRLQTLRQDDDGVTVGLEREGRSEELRVRYVIGADGAHSTVRHRLAVPFRGDAYETEFILGDVDVDAPGVALDELDVFMSRSGVLVLFPLPGGRVRVLATGYRAERDDELTLEELQERATALSHRADFRLHDPTWLSRFRLHHRGVDHYQVGRVFLAGDAAHIHSPAGGQGMNTGIQDAYNLAWKLAMVLRGEARPALLSSYEAERLPVGRRLLTFTDRLFSLISTTNPVAARLRNAVAPLVIPHVTRTQTSRMFTFASQIGIRYRRSPAVAEHLDGADRRFRAGPHAGDRAPGSPLPEGRLLPRMSGTHWWLLGLCGRGEEAVDPERLLARMQAACVDSPWIRPLVVGSSPSPGLDPEAWVHDPEGAVHQRYGVHGPGLYLIRPDGHIAFRSAGAGIDPLCAWLDAWIPEHHPAAPLRTLPAPTAVASGIG
ncbi:MAG: FAD-dependent monooxygenase [Myxococcales bacterium]|nr:FAD-dependent monooxygenase [Myxococcales bacterium]MCB9712719.1 FAD-dependent monooxygenase [Myxococcales bacterium]